MSPSASSSQPKSPPIHSASPHDFGVCPHCGGNGYMKTSPNCYHTCLKCLGLGYFNDGNSNENNSN